MASETSIVIMLRDPETGYLSKEIGAVRIGGDTRYLASLYASPADDGDMSKPATVHIRLTTERDLTDDEYEAVFDCYDEARIKAEVLDLRPVEDMYNPAWEADVAYTADCDALAETVMRVLALHTAELQETYALIQGDDETVDAFKRLPDDDDAFL